MEYRNGAADNALKRTGTGQDV